jgi:DNA-binding protein HU-beta
MTKDELAARVQAATGMSLTAATTDIDAIAAEIKCAVARGESVTLSKFGTFQPRVWPGRAGKHPLTGATVWLPETRVPHFKASSDFKEQVRDRSRAGAMTIKQADLATM